MKIFNQGRTGSPTYNYVNNRAKTQYSWAPSSRPNPRTDLGARSSRAIGNWWNNNFDEEESENVGGRGYGKPQFREYFEAGGWRL